MLKKLNIIKTEERENAPLFFLSFNNLTLLFDNRSEPLLSCLNLSIKYSRLLLIKGRVGSGKSSILKMIAGVIDPTAGEIIHTDKNGNQLQPIFIHSSSEFNFVTGYVRDELELSDIDKSLIDPTFLDRSIYDLSGGELKRLSIMIATLDMKRSVVLLDEPLDMLDDDWCDKITEQIVDSSKNRAFIIATHDHHFDKYADYIIHIT